MTFEPTPSSTNGPSLVLEPPKIPLFIPSTSTKQRPHDGVTYEFLQEPPQKFVCCICTQLVKDPHLTECCGHDFCENCLKEWEKKSKMYSCPHCRQLDFVHILDKQTRREVNEMKVHCPKRSQGCEWQGELSMERFHEKDCDYTIEKCRDCSASIPRKDLKTHSTLNCPFRQSECVYCNKKDAYFKVISFVHLAECPGYPMDCPNNCGATKIERSKISAHREECPLESVQCPLASAGCLETMPRKDLAAHVTENQGDHLLSLMKSFEKSQRELETQRGQLRELKMYQATTTAATTRIASNLDQLLGKSLTTQLEPLRSIRALLEPGAMILDSNHKEISLVLPNYTHFEKTLSALWESLPFYLDGGYKVCLMIPPRREKPREFGAEIRLMPGEFDSELQWPCNISFASIYLSLKRPEGANVSFSLTKKGETHFCLSTKGTRYNPSSPICSVLWHTDKLMDALPPYPSTIRGQYLHNDCLTISLTWVESQTTLHMLEQSLPQLTLRDSELSFNANLSIKSLSFGGSFVSVTASGSDQRDNSSAQIRSRRGRRRK